MPAFDPTDLDAIRAYLHASGEPHKPLTVRRIEVGETVLDGLADQARAEGAASRPTVLVMDGTPMSRAGAAVKPDVVRALRSVNADHFHVIELGQPDHPPHASADLAASLAQRMPPDALVIALGSGTITDLTKHAVFLAEQAAGARFTLICCPTACTVTAYTSTMTVLTVDGVKRTAASRGPDVVLVDLRLVTDAPPALAAAGFGDMMARCVAAGDWYLAHQLGLDPNFSELPLDMLAHAETLLFTHAAAIGRGEPAAVRHLVDALLMAGIAMSVANQTAPISGWEHTISHYLDLRHLATGQPLALHGAQVGAASLLAARAYADLFEAVALPDLSTSVGDESAARAALDAHFGPIASGAVLDELWTDFREKWEKWPGDPTTVQRFRDAWASGPLRADLRRYVREPARIARALTDVGAPLDLATSAGCDAGTARDAVRHAHRVRSRFTVGDLLDSLGWLTDDRLDRWMNPSIS